MAGQFYLTLPSNSSMEYFPGNTLTNFKTKLAQPIELTGEWEVALSEFQYPRSWYNLRDFDNHIYYDSGGQGFYSTSVIPHGYYPTIKEFVAAVNKTLKTDTNGDIWLTYNKITRKITVHVKNKAKLALAGRFASMIGFEKREVVITKKTEAPLPVNLEAGFHAMYLYTDIVEPQLVGDSKVSLLKVIKCKVIKVWGECDCELSQSSIYVPVNVKSFETVEIDIKDDTQEKVPFEFGKVIVTLHFRQRRSPLFI